MDRTHWQFCGVMNPETLEIEEVGAYTGDVELGLNPVAEGNGLKFKVLVLICEVKTRSIEDSRIGLRRILEERHPWVFEKFPNARRDLMTDKEWVAHLCEDEGSSNVIVDG